MLGRLIDWIDLLFLGGASLVIFVIVPEFVHWWRRRFIASFRDELLHPFITINFVKSLGFKPSADERFLTRTAADALTYLGLVQDDLEVWFVRSKGQPIVFRNKLIPWNLIGTTYFRDHDEMGDPYKEGYGGMRSGRWIYISTYKDGRPADAIFAHELAHLYNPMLSHHDKEFLEFELTLLGEMKYDE